MTPAFYEGWHFLAERGKLRDGSPAAPVGGVETFDGEPRLCASGLHACARAIDALQYAPGSYVRRVRLEGVVVGEGDKRSATRRVVLAEADATRVLHLFACGEAERALTVAQVKNRRCWSAIETKRRWVDGDATDKELRAASDAASWDAASTAASAAAWYASWYAAWDAASAASWYAAKAAAKAAASAAAWDAANGRLESALEDALES